MARSSCSVMIYVSVVLAFGVICAAAESDSQLRCAYGDPYGAIEIKLGVDDYIPADEDQNDSGPYAVDASWDILKKAADGFCVSFTPDDPQQLKILYPVLTAPNFLPHRVRSTMPEPLTFDLRAVTIGQGTATVDIHDKKTGRHFSWAVTISPDASAEYDVIDLLLNWRDAWAHEAQVLGYDDINSFLPRYIVTMVTRRCGIDELDNSTGLWRWFTRSDQDLELLKLLSGAHSLHLAMQMDLMLGDTILDEKAELSVPGDIDLPGAVIPPVEADVQIEQMAMHVPHECFYVWTSSWQNFEWLLGHGDRFSRAVSVNSGRMSLDFHLREKVEGQIALQQTFVSKMFGPQAIESVALIGCDPFLREGAALGVLFKAKNTSLLASHITDQRKDALDGDGVSETIIEIAGKKASFINSSDNRVRSFYVVDGDWHLVTNSRTIAERFIAVSAADGSGSLGASGEFKWGRSRISLDRGDDVFVFLSDAFMRNLTGGHYRIELNRRNLARNRIRLARMATEAARNELSRELDIAELIAAGYLPENFNSSPDGSHIIRDASGRLVCSLRGAPGSFLPVCDVDISAITPSEKSAWDRYKRQYQILWESLDPAIIAVKRGDDKISIDLLQTPYPRERYEVFTRFLTRANSVLITQPKDALVSGQVSINPALVLGAMGGDSSASSGGAMLGAMFMHNVFAGLQYFEVDLPDKKRGQSVKEYVTHIQNSLNPEEVLGMYGGESPSPQLMLMIGAGAAEADDDGYFQMDDFHGRSLGNIYSISNKRSLLEEITPQFKLAKAERRAQIRLVISRLDNRSITPFLKAMMIFPALHGSAANARALSDAVELLGISRQDAEKLLSELLAAELTCPLGGDFVTDKSQYASQPVISTAEQDYTNASGKAPGYIPELIENFRGGLLEFSVNPEDQILQVHLEFAKNN